MIVIAFALLATRVAQLQLANGTKYGRLALSQALHTIPLSAERGSVFDRNGRDLAMSIERTTVYADPTLVLDPAGEAAKLAAITHVDEQTLRARLSDRGTPQHSRRFVYVARTVADNVAQAVKDLNLPGIGFTPESARSYPAGSVAGALVGHVGTDGSGLDGTEYLYNSLMAGKAGEVVVEQDPQGHDIPDTQRTRIEAQRGTDVVLTVDEDVQWETEYSLLDQVTATQAKGGMAVVLDVTNGDVVAMATVRGASAKEPAHVARPGELNAPLTDLYEPGSTNKLITISTAIEHGLIGPDTRFTVPYRKVVDPHVPAYTDAEWHSTQNWSVADILRESSNVGTIEIAQKMHNAEVHDALVNFGFGQRTTIDWPYQPDGRVLPADQYYASGKYSTAIGYGASVTAMQVLGALTTIANHGTTRPPRLLDATIDGRGVRHAAPEPPGRRVVSPNTAAVMTRMLEGVVSGGTGACAAIAGYDVAGKTGTAKKVLPQGGYSDRATMASFEGFAPASNPRFAAIVVLDEPVGQFQFGGAAAAPVFSEVMQFALAQYGVVPTDTSNTQFNRAQLTARAAGNSCSVPHGAAVMQAILRGQQQQQPQHAQQAAAGHSGGAGTGGATKGSPTTADSLPTDPSKRN